MIEPSIAEELSPEPDLCRVSVVGGDTLVDIGLPAAVPIAAYIADVVALIQSRNPDVTEDDEGTAPNAEYWTLARLGRPAISSNRSLNDADVCDGELLVLRSVTTLEQPALFDDVIDAVARLTESTFRGWSADSANRTGMIAAVAAVIAAIGLLVGTRTGAEATTSAWIATGAGVVAMGAAAIAARVYRVEAPATVLSLCGCALICTGAALFVPGRVSSPHVMFGCAVTLVAAVAGYRLSGAGATVYAAIITMAAIGTAAAVVSVVWHPAIPKLGAGVAVSALSLITMVPRLAAGLARLPVPPVPAAGAAIDPADHEQRPTIEGIGAVGATSIPSAAGLHRRATVANQYQSGTLLGVTAMVVLGAFAAADVPGSARWSGIALAAVTGMVLCMRGRSFADLTQAATLIGGGAAILLGLPAALGAAQTSLRLLGAGLLLAYAAAALVFGVIGPTRELSPTARRVGEIIEYLLICLLFPLTLWTLDLYGLARNI